MGLVMRLAHTANRTCEPPARTHPSTPHPCTHVPMYPCTPHPVYPAPMYPCTPHPMYPARISRAADSLVDTPAAHTLAREPEPEQITSAYPGPGADIHTYIHTYIYIIIQITSAYPGPGADNATDAFLAPLDVAGYNYAYSCAHLSRHLARLPCDYMRLPYDCYVIAASLAPSCQAAM